MLNLISLSLCSALSSSVVLTPATALQHSPINPTVDHSSCLEQVTESSVETPITLSDADGSSGGSDRRGAGRRN